MKVQLFLIFLIFVYIRNSQVQGAYTIPNVKLELIPDGFRISIPDEPGISGVLYIMEINKKCSEMLNYVDKAVNNIWPSEQYNTKLEINDELGVEIWVQHKDDIFKGTQFFKVSSLTPVSNTNQPPAGSHPHSPPKPTQTPGQPPTTPMPTLMPTPPPVPPTAPPTVPPTAPPKVPVPPTVPPTVPLPTYNCIPAQTTVQGRRVSKCQDDLIYEQTFDGISELPRTQWNYDIRIRVNPTDTEEFSIFSDNKTNCFVNKGILNFVPTLSATDIRRGNIDLKGCTAINQRDCRRRAVLPTQFLPPIYTAQIHTRDYFSFKFGRIEVRAKLPKGDWLLPYIMLQPMTSYPDTDHATQLRVAFALGNAKFSNLYQEEFGGSRLHAGPVFWKEGGIRENLMKTYKGLRHYGDDFHIYTLTWTENKISVAVDGASYGDIRGSMKLFKEEFYIIMGVSAGGHQEFVDVGNMKPWKNTHPQAVLKFWKKSYNWIPSWNGGHAMQIDYVRVYAV